MDSPETWRWVWLAATAAFATGEIITTGFFLLPFAGGALVATILAFVGVSVAVQWVSFVAVSAVAFSALRPLARRLDEAHPSEGIGSRRLIGSSATVLEAIPGGPGATGVIRVDREEWRAESADGHPIHAGSPVCIDDVRGTRVVVRPLPESERSSS